MDTSKYNMDYRPKSYFGHEDWKTEVLLRINGKVRRKFVSDLIDSLEITTHGEYMEALNDGRIDAQLIRDQTMNEKMGLGAIHPIMMGGEFLPALDIMETEIVNIALESTTADVISIRAKAVGGIMRLSVVDEYDMEYEFSPMEIDRPFSMREIIDFIDNVELYVEGKGLNRVYREGNLNDDDPERLVNFVTISSDFYPELEDYYREDTQDWIAEVHERNRKG